MACLCCAHRDKSEMKTDTETWVSQPYVQKLEAKKDIDLNDPDTLEAVARIKKHHEALVEEQEATVSTISLASDGLQAGEEEPSEEDTTIKE